MKWHALFVRIQMLVFQSEESYAEASHGFALKLLTHRGMRDGDEGFGTVGKRQVTQIDYTLLRHDILRLEARSHHASPGTQV